MVSVRSVTSIWAMFCRWDYVSISEEAAKDVKRNLNNWTFLLCAAFQFNNESWSACACLWPCCWVMTPVAIQPYEFNLLMVLQRQLTNLGMVHASTWDSLQWFFTIQAWITNQAIYNASTILIIPINRIWNREIPQLSLFFHRFGWYLVAV